MKNLNKRIVIDVLIILSGILVMIKNEYNWGEKITSCTITGALLIILGGVLLILEMYFKERK